MSAPGRRVCYSEMWTHHGNRTLIERKKRQASQLLLRGQSTERNSLALDDYLNGLSYREVALRHGYNAPQAARRAIASEALYRLMQQSNIQRVEELGLRVRPTIVRCFACNSLHRPEEIHSTTPHFSDKHQHQDQDPTP